MGALIRWLLRRPAPQKWAPLGNCLAGWRMLAMGIEAAGGASPVEWR